MPAIYHSPGLDMSITKYAASKAETVIKRESNSDIVCELMLILKNYEISQTLTLVEFVTYAFDGTYIRFAYFFTYLSNMDINRTG